MRTRIILFFLIVVFAPATVVYCLFDRTHNFDKADCALCHEDGPNGPGKLKLVFSFVCLGCHAGVKGVLSHPYDILPGHNVPEDMPLVDGKVSCLTCHFVHPFSTERQNNGQSLLRGPGRGAAFCGKCHRIDGNGHFVFEKAHKGSYKMLARTGSLDSTSLQCIECHVDYLPLSLEKLGAGAWVHESRFIHPVGISYREKVLRKPGQFKPASAINGAIRFYDGKIGCGTCHSPYSKGKNMLVTNNLGGRLCTQCHIK